MTATDPIVQAVAEALHEHRCCPMDERGCQYPTDVYAEIALAEIAVAVARPVIEREAKVALIEKVKRLQDQIARARMEPGQDRQVAMHGYAERAERAKNERDALAARLAAVEAALTHAEQLPDAGNLYHDVTYRDGVEHTVARLRATLNAHNMEADDDRD